MITYLQTIVPATGQVAIVFSVGDPPIPYTTAPFDRAAFLAMAPAQRRAAIIAAAKAALPPPRSPQCGPITWGSTRYWVGLHSPSASQLCYTEGRRSGEGVATLAA